MRSQTSFFFLVLLTCLFHLPFFCVTSAQKDFGFGCEFESFDSTLVIKAQFPEHRGALPSSISLQEFAPVCGDQGNLNSCAAWASAYAGLTIVRGVENQSKQLPCDPMHLYNRVQTSLNRPPCAQGSTISTALNILKNNGCMALGEYAKKCGAEPVTQKYPFDLYDFQRLNITVNDLKSALVAQQPIVAAFKSYDYKGWEKEEYLIQGVWNGKFDTPATSGHAMCIMGYDDQKQGGAFQVMNSWGQDWGANGCFWIRYQDVVENIKTAYSLVPHPEGQSIPSPLVNGQKLEVHNDCFDPVYLALATQQDGEWISKGWYPVQPFEQVQIDISQRTANEFLWTAANHNMKIAWDNTEAPLKLCADLEKSFEFSDHTCAQPIGFNNVVPKAGQDIHVLYLGCPSIVGRNAEVLYVPDYFEAEKDPRDPSVANQQWSANYALFDLFTQRMIHPSLDENGEYEYNVWLTDGIQSPQNKIYSPFELEMDTRFKFQSKSSAEQFIQWKNP